MSRRKFSIAIACLVLALLVLPSFKKRFRDELK